MLGVYSTRESAMAAVERFRKLPGFRDVPQMAEHTDALGNPEGFYLNEYPLDLDHWSEGYDTL
jgi:hypothetical protein